MLAQLNFDTIQGSLKGNIIPKTPGEVITKMLPFVFYGAGIALLIYLVIGGLQMMVARGDPKAIQAAQAKITNALIGFIIVIVSFVLVGLIGQLLGIGAFETLFK